MISRGRREAFDAHAVLSGVRGAEGALELSPVGRLADVGGAEVERPLRRIDVDRVEEPAAEHLDAGDVAVAKRSEFLHQRGVVDAEIEQAVTGGAARARPAMSNRWIPAPLPPMFAFTSTGKRSPFEPLPAPETRD